MNSEGHTTGVVVFFRTDMPHFPEVNVPFDSLEELLKICRCPPEDTTIDRIIIMGKVNGEPCTATLQYESLSCGAWRQMQAH